MSEQTRKYVPQSKKLRVLIANIVVVVCNQYLGLGLDVDTLAFILGISATYILGQGVADAGKEAKKLE